MTEGAACTVLTAIQYIDDDNDIIIANSDQYIEWKPEEFFYLMNNQMVDAGILTFKATHPKWSFVKLNDEEHSSCRGFVSEVAEKKPISNIATTGIYYWKHGADLVKYANQMIDKDIRVNNEYYVCPIFNEAILDGKKIKVDFCEKMWGLGTPEDLNAFLKQK